MYVLSYYFTEEGKSGNIYFRGVLYLMYNEYKAAEYNAEMNESRKHSNGRWGNCGRFLADALI